MPDNHSQNRSGDYSELEKGHQQHGSKKLSDFKLTVTKKKDSVKIN